MKIALENQFDAIVADAVMPNLTGFDLCRILKENQFYKNIPIIILSGFENTSETNLADAYLLKGNDIKETLLETISSLISSNKLVTN
jgi:CheY-like chemotaxis protein